MGLICSVTHRVEDAGRKWCPFSWTRSSGMERYHATGQQNISVRKKSDKRGDAVHGHCLASGCMAWIDETDHVHEIAMGRCGLISGSLT